MTKMFKKSKLSYKNGYIVKDGKVIGISNAIVAALNKLEREYQEWLHDQGKVMPMPVDEDPFEFETEHGKVYPKVSVDTPALDKKAAETLKIMEELDNVEKADKINDVLRDNLDLIAWLDSKHIVESKQQCQMRFDLKYIGNPLEFTKDRFCDMIIAMNS